MPHAKTNGKPKKPLLSKKPATAGYDPIPHQLMWQRPRDLPPFTFLTIQAMLIDPTIRLGLAMRAAPLCAAEFAYKQGDSWKEGIQADDPMVAAFVERQLKRVWRDVDVLLKGQVWGWSAAEVCYRLANVGKSNPIGRPFVEVDRLLARHSNDTRAIECGGEVKAVRFLRVTDKPGGHVDLPFPKAVFHTHAPEPGSVYGTSICHGAYSPWADKWLNGGALDVRRLFMHKDAYRGMKIGYPSDTYEINGVTVPARDLAREMVEQTKAGGVITHPSDTDPVTKAPKWTFGESQVSSNPQHILQYPKDLDAEMLRGMECPDDIFTQDADSGGSWAGKLVPMQAFYTGLDIWLGKLLKDIDAQIIQPLVRDNFGDGCYYEIDHKPLGIQAMEQQGEQGARKPAGQPSTFSGGWQGDNEDGFQDAQPQRMSLEASIGRGVLKASKVVEAARGITRMEALPAGARWVTIGGRKSAEGERKGGFPVLIDDDGNILRSGGPKSLVGKNVSDSGDHLEGERRRDAHQKQQADEASGPLGNSRSWRKIVDSQAAKWKIDADTYEGVASQVWEDEIGQHEERESAKKFARDSLKLNSADIARLENQGLDYASTHKRIKELDTLGREMASLYPALGWGGGYDSGSERSDYDSLVWELIKEGKQETPSRISREFHQRVNDYLSEELARHKRKPKQAEPEEEYDATTFGLKNA